MGKFKAVETPIKKEGYINSDYIFYCNGCKCHHGVWTTNKNGNNAIWQFNNDLNKPTVSPSILVHWVNKGKDFICHSFINNGNIQYLGDCTHELRNTTIELPEIEA